MIVLCDQQIALEGDQREAFQLGKDRELPLRSELYRNGAQLTNQKAPFSGQTRAESLPLVYQAIICRASAAEIVAVGRSRLKAHSMSLNYIRVTSAPLDQ